MRLWMVDALGQPLLRITHAALPVKAANRTLPSTPSAMCLTSVVLPVPAYPNNRKMEERPRAPLSQFEAAVSAASWWGVKTGMGKRALWTHKEQNKNDCQPSKTANSRPEWRE